MKKFKEKACLDCGVVFQPTGANHKRCTNCAHENQKKQIREYMQERRRREGRNVGVGSGNAQPLGENHPKWKHGEQAFQQRLAPEYTKKARYCERCGKDLKDVKPHERCVHHIDHDRTNNHESNFELLCKRCHLIEHRVWENFWKGSTTIREE